MTTPETPQRVRRGRSFKLVGGVFFALIALGLAGAIYVYFALIRYERVAALHLPADTTSAVRVDLEKVVLYEPFRKHLLPLVDDIERRPELAPRLERIQQKTKIELALDIREIVLARAAAERWLVVIGGKFPTTGVVAGLADVLHEDGVEVRLDADGRTLELAGRGIAIGQADDGAIVVASNRHWLDAALPAQPTHRRLGLGRETGASFSVAGGDLGWIGRHPAALAIPALAEVACVRRVSGEIGLGSPLHGTAWFEVEPTDPTAAAARVSSLISALERLVHLSGSDVGGEARVLDSARVAPRAVGSSSDGSSVVQVEFDWQRADLDQVAGSLADRIRASAGSRVK